MSRRAEESPLFRRLCALDLSQPRFDKAAAEAAIERYLAEMHLPRRRVFFADSPNAVVAATRHLDEVKIDWVWFDRSWKHFSMYSLTPIARRAHELSAAGELTPLLEYDATMSATLLGLEDAPRLLQPRYGDGRQAQYLFYITRTILACAVAAELHLNLAQPALIAALAALAEAGIVGFWVLAGGVVALRRPAVWCEASRLHRAVGPAVRWADGTESWCWQGIEVPQRVVEHPETLTPGEILAETNAEVRRVMLDRFGWERFDRETTSRVIDHDERWGTLVAYNTVDPGMFGSISILDHRTGEFVLPPGDMLALRVVNRSPEPDGSYRRYVLPVHPTLCPIPDTEAGETAFGPSQALTALNAVASTFGMTGAMYEAALGAES